MVPKSYKKSTILIALLGIHATSLLCNYETLPTRFPVDCSLKPYNVTILLVTDNGDDPTNPATLRGALAIAEPGDVINFALPGGSEEILLDEIYGPLVIQVPLIIDGSNTAGSGVQVTVNGQNEINIGFLVANTAPSTTIQNITIINFSGNGTDPGTGTAPQELPAYGILTNAVNTFINNCTIENITSGIGEEAAGIRATIQFATIHTCPIVNNTITNIRSTGTMGTIFVAASGNVYGIFVSGNIQGQCSNNTISFLVSGDASGIASVAGDVKGISVTGSIQGDCIYNTLNNFTGGSGIDSGTIAGIEADSIIGNCSCNILTDFETRGDSNTVDGGHITGISVDTSIIGHCSYNRLERFATENTAGDSGRIRGITLQEAIHGDFSHNLMRNFLTGNAISSVGSIIGLSANRIGGTTSHNTLSLFTTGMGANSSGAINGLSVTTFDADVVHNVLELFTTGSSTVTGRVEGISSPYTPSEIGGTLAYNRLSQFTTGNGIQSSGSIKGVEMSIISGRVHDNLLEQFTTGDVTLGVGNLFSGAINGIEILTYLRGDMVNNTVRQLLVSNVATIIGFVQGIFIRTINSERLVACNIVDTLQGNSPAGSETSSSSYAIAIEQGDSITICHNTITNLTGLAGAPIYGLLLGDDPQDQSITNSTIGDNTISNIFGGNKNGFGIVIVDENSLGNKLFNNLIFNINGKAIVILDPLADTTDKTVTLSSVQCTGSGKLIISGSFNPDPNFINQPFLLQFFVSDSNTPPQAQQLIGEQTIIAQGMPTLFVVEFKPCPPTETGQYLTATATALVDPNNNTTELSNALAACDSINPLCVIILSQCEPPPPPEVCPIDVINGPPVPAPCPEVVVPPCPGTEFGSGTGH